MSKKLPATNNPSGDASVDKCKADCYNNLNCSGIVWYASEHLGSKCKLMLGDTPATKGRRGTQRNDAICYIKPSHRKTET